MYWMVDTGTNFSCASIATTSYVTSLKILDSEAISGIYELILRWLPFLLSFFAFMGLYILVPNKKVYISHAFIGAILAALLFEASKKGFAAYITQFPRINLLRRLSGHPNFVCLGVFMLLIVLIGAEVTAALGERDQWSGPSKWYTWPQIMVSRKKESIVIALIQRVSEAAVRVNGEVIGEINHGLLVLLGVEKGDDEAKAKRLVERVTSYRVFSDEKVR